MEGELFSSAWTPMPAEQAGLPLLIRLPQPAEPLLEPPPLFCSNRERRCFCRDRRSVAGPCAGVSGSRGLRGGNPRSPNMSCWEHALLSCHAVLTQPPLFVRAVQQEHHVADPQPQLFGILRIKVIQRHPVVHEIALRDRRLDRRRMSGRAAPRLCAAGRLTSPAPSSAPPPSAAPAPSPPPNAAGATTREYIPGSSSSELLPACGGDGLVGAMRAFTSPVR